MLTAGVVKFTCKNKQTGDHIAWNSDVLRQSIMVSGDIYINAFLLPSFVLFHLHFPVILLHLSSFACRRTSNEHLIYQKFTSMQVLSADEIHVLRSLKKWTSKHMYLILVSKFLIHVCLNLFPLYVFQSITQAIHHHDFYTVLILDVYKKVRCLCFLSFFYSSHLCMWNEK